MKLWRRTESRPGFASTNLKNPIWQVLWFCLSTSHDSHPKSREAFQEVRLLMLKLHSWRVVHISWLGRLLKSQHPQARQPKNPKTIEQCRSPSVQQSVHHSRNTKSEMHLPPFEQSMFPVKSKRLVRRGLRRATFLHMS